MSEAGRGHGADMQHVLVHIDLDSGLGPIGVWGYKNGRLTHFYPESLSPAISARARDYMAARYTDQSIPEWFAFLEETATSAFDEFEAVEVNDDVSLPDVLAVYRRTWAATA